MSSNASIRPTSVTTDMPEETHSLISARKVNGTRVYNGNHENLGTIADLMIDKRSGKVAYAVMSFGGFLGMGEKYHPLPWNLLTYDEGLSGYNIDLSTDKLRAAPAYTELELNDFETRNYGRDVQKYYGTGRGL